MGRLSAALLLSALTVVLMSAEANPASNFYTARYGKRSDFTAQSSDRSSSGFHANRSGRSGETLEKLVPRSSRFIPGSRYGKRADGAAADILDESAAPSLLLGSSTLCLLVDQPDLYRCTRTPSSGSMEVTE